MRSGAFIDSLRASAFADAPHMYKDKKTAAETLSAAKATKKFSE